METGREKERREEVDKEERTIETGRKGDEKDAMKKRWTEREREIEKKEAEK